MYDMVVNNEKKKSVGVIRENSCMLIKQPLRVIPEK